jgi:hypothetical protein
MKPVFALRTRPLQQPQRVSVISARSLFNRLFGRFGKNLPDVLYRRLNKSVQLLFLKLLYPRPVGFLNKFCKEFGRRC